MKGHVALALEMLKQQVNISRKWEDPPLPPLVSSIDGHVIRDNAVTIYELTAVRWQE